MEYKGRKFPCMPAELRKLGQTFNNGLESDKQKLSEGVNQFKIEFTQFRDWWQSENWLSGNSLVAVSAGSDGPSGVKDDGWAAIQEEIWRFAQIIFSGNPSSRSFWVGNDQETADKALRLGGPKPCLHGSDAHCLEKLFAPDLQRYCWIKADPTFEGLRQTLYEPEERVYIGQESPKYYDSSRVLSSLQVRDGLFPAFQTEAIELNPGLVAIIGPKGSGKSALARRSPNYPLFEYIERRETVR